MRLYVELLKCFFMLLDIRVFVSGCVCFGVLMNQILCECLQSFRFSRRACNMVLLKHVLGMQTWVLSGWLWFRVLLVFGILGVLTIACFECHWMYFFPKLRSFKYLGAIASNGGSKPADSPDYCCSDQTKNHLDFLICHTMQPHLDKLSVKHTF